eukprot:8461072-Pyramimonas_sp.AAC.2
MPPVRYVVDVKVHHVKGHLVDVKVHIANHVKGHVVDVKVYIVNHVKGHVVDVKVYIVNHVKGHALHQRCLRKLFGEKRLAKEFGVPLPFASGEAQRQLQTRGAHSASASACARIRAATGVCTGR